VLPGADHDPVSPSPFKNMSALAPMMKLVPPAQLREAALAEGFTAADAYTVEPASGKRFWVEIFAAPGGRADGSG